jgi:hypothetical protein
MKKYCYLVFIILSPFLYAAPPEKILTNSTPSPTIGGPQADNNGFIIKDSNTKVQKFKEHNQDEKTAVQESLKNKKEGVYPVLQKSPDPYGLNPSDNN